ncbi:hypothetical protein KW805_01335 [Candidatus Pacearchaeota archaeon]|nr:hypothetical protein [Candidatus Pacearchaeota archaeon]
MVTKVDEGIYVVQLHSPKMKAEVLEGFPIPPMYGNVTFMAHGILVPSSRDDGEKYVSDCKKNHVIPDTRAKFLYNFNSNNFSSERDDNPLLCDPIEGRDRGLHTLFEGGKIHTLRFDFGYMNEAPEGFEHFRDHLLGALLKNDYQVIGGDLWITHHHFTGYNYGDEMADGLIIRPNLLKLTLNQNLEDEGKLMYKKWFSDLAKKHNAQIFGPR